jgi:GNAT superfamily N-acetyltransferase
MISPSSPAASPLSIGGSKRELYPDRPAARPGPCLLLGQLATDQNWIGKGIGTGLLKHALQRCVTAADLIGGRTLLVNAVDIEAAAFWKRRGFIPSRDDPLILFRSIADIAASLH